MNYSAKQILEMSDQDVLSLAEPDIKRRLGNFVREFNRREWSVRIDKSYSSFEDYANNGGYKHQDEFGYGFVVDNRPVPYFHPNRSFHDEIIWLNSHLYYRPDVSFEDKLINSAVVKFYGPARTLDIITGNTEDLPYIIKTDSKFINFNLLKENKEYEHVIMSNIERAFASGQRIWGTTELRTSLQTASRNYARHNPSIIDELGPIGKLGTHINENQLNRSMRPSDMIHWIKSMSDEWLNFYSSKPSMEDSFNFLTSTRGIGNYYGYHFSSNLARMPGVGAGELIEAEYSKQFKNLQKYDTMLSHGNLDENSDYVIAGPGSTATLKRLFSGQPSSMPVLMRYLVAIRNHQEEFFGISGNLEAERHLKEASELGRFTTFGTEISCCQFNVFERAISDYRVASGRANAPISMMPGLEDDAAACSIQPNKLF